MSFIWDHPGVVVAVGILVVLWLVATVRRRREAIDRRHVEMKRKVLERVRAGGKEGVEMSSLYRHGEDEWRLDWSKMLSELEAEGLLTIESDGDAPKVVARRRFGGPG